MKIEKRLGALGLVSILSLSSVVSPAITAFAAESSVSAGASFGVKVLGSDGFDGGGEVILGRHLGGASQYYYISEGEIKTFPAGEYDVFYLPTGMGDQFSVKGLTILENGDVTVQDKGSFGEISYSDGTLTVKPSSDNGKNTNVRVFYDNGVEAPKVNVELSGVVNQDSTAVGGYCGLMTSPSYYHNSPMREMTTHLNPGVKYTVNGVTSAVSGNDDEYEITKVYNGGTHEYDTEAPFTFSVSGINKNDVNVFVKKKNEEKKLKFYIEFPAGCEGMHNSSSFGDLLGCGETPDGWNVDEYGYGIVGEDGTVYPIKNVDYDDYTGNKHPEVFFKTVDALPNGTYKLVIKHPTLPGIPVDDALKIKDIDGNSHLVNLNGSYEFTVNDDTESIILHLKEDGTAENVEASANDTAYSYISISAARDGGPRLQGTFTFKDEDGTLADNIITKEFKNMVDNAAGQGLQYAAIKVPYGAFRSYTFTPNDGGTEPGTLYLNPTEYGTVYDVIYSEKTPENIEVPVNVVWEDNNDSAGLRPQKVIGSLFYKNRRNTESENTQYIDDESWKQDYEVENTVLEDGIVVPEKVAGYDGPIVKQNAENDGFTIYYSREDEEPAPDPEPEPTPSTPSEIPKPTPSEIPKPTPSEVPKPSTPSEIPTPAPKPTPKPSTSTSTGGGGSSVIGHGIPITTETPKVPEVPIVPEPTPTPSDIPKKPSNPGSPKTGDPIGVFALMTGLGAAGYVATRKKNEDDE